MIAGIAAAIVTGLVTLAATFFLGYLSGCERTWWEYRILYGAGSFTRKERKQMVAEEIRRRAEAE